MGVVVDTAFVLAVGVTGGVATNLLIAGASSPLEEEEEEEAEDGEMARTGDAGMAATTWFMRLGAGPLMWLLLLVRG